MNKKMFLTFWIDMTTWLAAGPKNEQVAYLTWFY